MGFTKRRRICAVRSRLAALLLAIGALTAPRLAAAQGPVLPPPMGWSSWNSFASKIDYATIQRQVDALIALKMDKSGYTYVNIDEGWWHGTRDASGNIVVDTAQWPGGMAAIASYIHSKGLKAGIYTDAGKQGCGYYYPTNAPAYAGAGSEGHYQQDLQQFQAWGFDYVKVDWCGGSAEKLDPQATYTAIRTALDATTRQTGRSMILSLCEWGNGQPWNWGAALGALWRTSNDIYFYGSTASIASVLNNFDQAQHPLAQHTGAVNDPDMLVVGMNGLSDAQARLHMGLWAISGAPLIAGLDLTKITSTTLATLTNKGVIDIDQDSRGLQGVKVAEDSLGLQVYAKVLAGSGKRAALLLNRTGAAATVALRLADLGLAGSTATAREVWSGSQIGTIAGTFSMSVPAGDAVLLAISGTDPAPTVVNAAKASVTGSAALSDCATCSGGKIARYVGNGSTVTLPGVTVPTSGLATMDIAYVNGDATPRTAILSVNGSQWPTTVAFPPTGSWSTLGTVSVAVSLAKGGNTVAFSNPATWTPDIAAVAVAPLPGAAGVEMVGSQSNRCLDVNNNSTTDGTVGQIWDCAAGANQVWRPSASGQLVVYGAKCLDAAGAGTTSGTPVQIWACHGGANQQWRLTGDGTIVGVQSGLCLDVTGQGSGNGTKVQLWTCNGQPNQKWRAN